MAKSKDQEFPQAYHDFYKTNGLDTAFYCEGPSMTRQEFAEDSDINNIMARYQVTGQLPLNDRGEPMYVDFTQMPTDLMSTLQLMDEAEAAFMRLPAIVRKEFDNDAAQFVEYASNPDNLAQMQAWGLAKPAEERPEPAAPPAPPSADPAPGGAPEAPAEPPKKAPKGA